MPETTRAEQMFGDFAPKLVSLTTGVLFADIWERTELAARDRSLITVAALVATGSTGTSFRVGTGPWSHARTDPLCAAWREDERRTWRRVVSDRSESPRARALDAVQPRSEMRGVAWEQGPARS